MASRIGRPVDPRYPTNVAIAAVTGIAFVAAILYTLQDGLDVRWAGRIAITGFMAWAIAREVDPDHPLSAFLAAGLGLGLSAIEPPSLLFSFWLLLCVRILNRTPGTPSRIDGIIVVGLSVWLATQGTWIASVLTAGAFLADGRLHEPDQERMRLAPLPLLGLLLAWPLEMSWSLAWLHLALIPGALLLVWPVRSACDRGKPLDSHRVRAGVMLVMLAVAVEPHLGLAGAAALGAGAWRLGVRVLEK